MIETKSKQIGPYTFHVEQFGAKEGSRWLVVLARMLGTTIGEAVTAVDALNGISIGKVVATFTASVTVDGFEQIRDAFIAKTTVTGGQFGNKQPRLSEFFDVVFAGRYSDMLAWLGFCLETNYADFFGAFRNVVVQTNVPPVSPEPVKE